MPNALITKIQRCSYWRSLYALAEEFVQNGLAIKLTEGGRHALCRIQDGKPIHEQIVNDYIFIESANSEFDEIPQRSLDLIIQFVRQNASTNALADQLPTFRRNAALYGQAIRVANEEKVMAEQFVHAISRLIVD